MRVAFLSITLLGAFSLTRSVTQAQDVPAFEVLRDQSSIHFSVKASVAIEGTFDKWDSTLTYTSADAQTGVFDVKENPFITFHSDKLVQTSPDTFELHGMFTIRGVSKPEVLELKLFGKGTGSGEVKGVMAFDRKDYGMNSGIPFIKIADRVEVSVDLKAKRVSGPPLVFQQ